MTDSSQKEKVVAATAIFKMKMQQTVERIEVEHLHDMQPQVQNPMEKVNLNTVEELRITYISSFLPSNLKEEIIAILQEFKDCFAWNCDEMPGLDRSLVEHRLPIKSKFHPF